MTQLLGNPSTKKQTINNKNKDINKKYNFSKDKWNN